MPRLSCPLAFATFATLALTCSVQADPATAPAFAPPPPISAQQQSQFLKPYLNDETFMVIHADAALIDTAALEKFLTDTLAAAIPDHPDAAQKVAAARLIADAFLARFKQLGGRQIYFVQYQTGDRTPHDPIAFFPLEPNGDAKTLAVLLTTIPGLHGQPLQLSDSLVAVGPPTLEDDLKAIVPSPRPDYDKALAAGSGAFQLAMSPGAASRTLFSEKNPTLPPELGGGSSDIVFKAFQYMTLSISPPPAPKVSFLVQSDSPDNAKLSADLINKWSAMMSQMTNRGGNPVDLASIFAPVITGSAVTVDLDAAKLQSAANAIVPSMFSGRQRAQAVSSMSNIKQNLLGALMYAADNNNNWPPDLHTIVDKGYLPSDKTFTNPADPKHRAYEYHPWSPDELKKLDPATTPVMWEASDSDTVRLNVGYLDGHVESVPSKAELTKQLDAAKEKLKTP